MKVKNIMFSGFAAAVFATVCGAAVAADVSLISKDYADAKLQAKLTEGQGIDIVTAEDGTTTISADVDLSSLATKTSVETLAGTVGDETKGLVKVVADLETNKANVTDVYSKTVADEKFMIMEDANALGANLQWTSEGKLDTKGIATADGLEKLDERVNGSAQTEGSVAYDIAAALTSANTYTDAEVKELAEGQVATNTANIALKANSADVYTKDEVNTALEGVRATADAAQTAEEVSSAIDTKISDLKLGETYATVSALDGVKATAEAAQTAEEVSSAIDTKISDLKLGETYATVSALDGVRATAEAAQTAEEVSSAIDTKISDLKLDENYQAKLSETQLAAVNSGVDSDKVAAIATNTQGIAENAAEIAKKVSVVTTAGTYLVNFDATGAVSYAPIKILDKDGNEITLNGESAVKPSAN